MQPADGDRNAELSNANKSFADHRVTGDLLEDTYREKIFPVVCKERSL
jgi:hypothetical protein